MTILIQMVARLLFLPTLIVAIAILIKGYHSTGDGFSAGVIASTGFVLQYVVFGIQGASPLLSIHKAITTAFTGLLVIMLVVFTPLIWDVPLLTHVPAPQHPVRHFGALELHTALLFDTGVFLLVFGFIVATLQLIARTAKECAR
jgi:multisubunit Na+/H+ antiporter MnhB subunit